MSVRLPIGIEWFREIREKEATMWIKRKRSKNYLTRILK